MKQTKKQRKAHNRNWSKGLLTGMVKNLNNIKQLDGLSLSEQMKILSCKKIINDMLTNWKPTL